MGTSTFVKLEELERLLHLILLAYSIKSGKIRFFKILCLFQKMFKIFSQRENCMCIIDLLVHTTYKTTTYGLLAVTDFTG